MQQERPQQDRTSHSQQPERPLGLSRSNSQQQQQPQSQQQRGQHRRSPTAPEAHHPSNVTGHSAHLNGIQTNGGGVAKGKTWSMGAEVMGEVDRDLGGLGSLGDAGVREKDPRESKAPPPAIQVNGGKNFTVCIALLF